MDHVSLAHELERISNLIRQNDVYIVRRRSGFKLVNEDIASPDVVVSICLQGNAKVLCDFQEYEYHKNDLSIIMPGHILRQLECSPDFVITRLYISHDIYPEMKAQLFSHGYEKFYLSPFCNLTDTQVERLLKVIDLLGIIADHDKKDLQLRRHLLIGQLTVGYEFVNYYRRELDKGLALSHSSRLYNDFCNLIAEHYQESREVKYYAKLLNLTPKYFSKVITRETGGLSPADSIESFVIAHAKRLIDTRPDCTLSEISYMLGFSEPSSFYRYFKHATGITAMQYRNSSN